MLHKPQRNRKLGPTQISRRTTAQQCHVCFFFFLSFRHQVSLQGSVTVLPSLTSSVTLIFTADVNQPKVVSINEATMAASSAPGLFPAAGSSKDYRDSVLTCYWSLDDLEQECQLLHMNGTQKAHISSFLKVQHSSYAVSCDNRC